MLAVLARKPAPGPADWSVYILRCADGTFYTGVTNDVDARVSKHNSGKGAAYTRTRVPVELLYREDELTRSQALVREAAIKRLSRPHKERLISVAPAKAGAQDSLDSDFRRNDKVKAYAPRKTARRPASPAA